MQTKVIHVDDRKTIKTDVIGALKAGELVAFPTETVYGLGADATNSEAIQKIFQVKNRPADNPLIVHFSSLEMVQEYLELKPKALAFAQAFWPGPLSLVVPKPPLFPTEVSAGLNTISIRVPKHPDAIHLIQAAGIPIAAPSANLSGRPSPTSAGHVLDDLDGQIAYVIDGGKVSVGVESTVLDTTITPPVVLRPGGITLEQLRAVDPSVVMNMESADRPKAPGMKYRHYAPNVKIILFEHWDDLKEKMKWSNRSEMGILCLAQLGVYPNGVTMFEMATVEEYAQKLYGVFRQAEKSHLKELFIQVVVEKGIGVALMNRIFKAAATE